MNDYDRLNLRGALIYGDRRVMARAASAIDGLADALRDAETDESLKRSGLYTALNMIADCLHERVEYIEELQDKGEL